MPCLYGKIRTRKQSAKKRIKTGKKMESTSFWNPESTAWNPESKTVLDSLTWGERKRRFVLWSGILIQLDGSETRLISWILSQNCCLNVKIAFKN